MQANEHFFTAHIPSDSNTSRFLFFPTVVGSNHQQGAVIHRPSCESTSNVVKRQKNIRKMARALTEDQLARDVFTSLQVKDENPEESGVTKGLVMLIVSIHFRKELTFVVYFPDDSAEISSLVKIIALKWAISDETC